MTVNPNFIVGLRKQRSWSQDELAGASGLNLRTIQRIERTGVASLQSRKALASAFDLEPAELDSKEEPMVIKFEYRVVRFDMKWNRIGFKLATDFPEMEAQMNLLGSEGWELVKMSEVIGGAPYTVALVATFKRTVPSP